MRRIRSRRLQLLTVFAIGCLLAMSAAAPIASAASAATAAGAGATAVVPQAEVEEATPCPFRDVRRAPDINCGPDLGGTNHEAVNFTGSTGSAGDSWITVLDQTPETPDQDIVTGSVTLSSDVLIHPFNNKKGAGLLALFNEGSGKKGLALIPYDNGNTDKLTLNTIDATTGKLTVLANLGLCLKPGTSCRGGDAGIAENAWYRLTMTVTISGNTLTVGASVFAHTTPTDPNSALDGEIFQTPATLNYSGSLAGLGLQNSGEIGTVASAVSAVVDSSVTNFGQGGCAQFPIDIEDGAPGVTSPTPTTLLAAIPLNNVGDEDLQNVTINSITLASGTLTTPALPDSLGTLPASGSKNLDTTFSGGPFVGGNTYKIEIKGTYQLGAVQYCFLLTRDLRVPPAAPGSALLGTFTVGSSTITGGGFAHQPLGFDEDEENGPNWVVPTGPNVPGTPETNQTGFVKAPLGDPPAISFTVNNSVGLTSGGSNGTASSVAEPSGSATGGGVVFMTANWTAAYSNTNGSPGSFTQLDPTTIFPADTVGFCCDQIVQYVPSINRFVWLLQGTGFRLAVASPAQVISSGGTAWTYWNLTQTLFGQCVGFDYPDLSVGDNALYISWDAGSGGTCSGGFQVARTSLAGLQAGGTISIDFTNPANGPMAWGSHLMQDTGNEIFWAGHNSNSNMRIFSLAEGSNTYFWRDRDVSSWANNAPTSTTPDSQDWLAKNFNGPGGNSFPRNGVIGATRSGNQLWFGWTAGTNGTFAQAHIEIAVFDRSSDFTKIAQHQVWNSAYAFAYPAFATNVCTGEIGMAFEFGGGGNYENFVVGFWGDFVAYVTTASNVGTTRFGDYVSIRQLQGTTDNPGNLFAAFGYGLKNPVPPQVGTQTDVHYVNFGRPASSCNSGPG